MRRILLFLLFVGFGLLAPFVFILGAEPFEVPGQNPIMERIGGSLAVALYCAACQFWFARRDARAATSSWPSVVAMALPLVASCLIVIASEGGQSWRYFAIPFLVAGCIGAVLGMALGHRTGGASVA